MLVHMLCHTVTSTQNRLLERTAQHYESNQKELQEEVGVVDRSCDAGVMFMIIR